MKIWRLKNDGPDSDLFWWDDSVDLFVRAETESDARGLAVKYRVLVKDVGEDPNMWSDSRLTTCREMIVDDIPGVIHWACRG